MINLYVNMLEQQPIVLMIWQLHRVRKNVTTSTVGAYTSRQLYNHSSKYYKNYLDVSVRSQFSFVSLDMPRENSDTGRPDTGEGEFNQETASTKINIEEDVGLIMVKQRLQEQIDATGKTVVLSR